jgi:atypical dual specificity phosphatase
VSEWFEAYGFRTVGDGLVSGAVPRDEGDVDRLVAEAGVTRVVNLCQDVEYEGDERRTVQAAYARHAVAEHRIDLEDFGHVRPGALDAAVAVVVPWLRQGETVYVHCRAGWQRSATVAAGVLAVHLGVEPDEALGRIQRRKPSAQPLHHQLEGLWRWWRLRGRPGAGSGAVPG